MIPFLLVLWRTAEPACLNAEKMCYNGAMMNIDKILAELEPLKPELRRLYKVREIGLFGSWARGEQHAESDIDVLVEFEDDADLFDWMGLTLYLEDLFGRPVDVVPRKALRPELESTVLEQVVKI